MRVVLGMGLKAEIEGRLASWWGWKCDVCALLGGGVGDVKGREVKKVYWVFLMSENGGSGLSHRVGPVIFCYSVVTRRGVGEFGDGSNQ